MTNEQMLCLLYHEAKFNVVQGRYSLYMEDYHRLAGLQVNETFPDSRVLEGRKDRLFLHPTCPVQQVSKLV